MEIRMIALFLALALPAESLQDKEDPISSSVKQLVDAGSYTFVRELKMDNPGFGERRGGEIPSMKGAFQKDVGMRVSMGDWLDMFRAGEKGFVRWGGREWQPMESGEKKEKKEKRGRGRRGRRGSSRFLGWIRPPHLEIEQLAGSLSDVKTEGQLEKIGELECRPVVAKVPRDKVQSGSVGRMLERFGASEEAEITGNVRAWLGPKGELVRYEVTTSVEVEFQGNPVSFSIVRAYTFSKVGETRVEIPEGVRELLGTPSVDKKKEE